MADLAKKAWYFVFGDIPNFLLSDTEYTKPKDVRRPLRAFLVRKGNEKERQMAELKTVPIGAIKPYENNPRKNDEAVAAVAESIRQCGYIAPIVVDEEMTVLAGHTRLKALQSLGKADAEVLIRAGLTDEQKRKYRILDNKTAELADWDFDLLEQELAGLDFDGFDFDFGIEPADKEDAFDDDYIEEVPANPKSKPGQLYLLGHHRLLCGDATSEEDVRRVNGGGTGRPTLDRSALQCGLHRQDQGRPQD